MGSEPGNTTNDHDPINRRVSYNQNTEYKVINNKLQDLIKANNLLMKNMGGKCTQPQTKELQRIDPVVEIQNSAQNVVNAIQESPKMSEEEQDKLFSQHTKNTENIIKEHGAIDPKELANINNKMLTTIDKIEYEYSKKGPQEQTLLSALGSLKQGSSKNVSLPANAPKTPSATKGKN